MYCTDPGEVEHSTRLISDPVLLVGTTIQYTCSPGFVLEGSSLLTCYSRETGTPIWTSRLPHCVCKSMFNLGSLFWACILWRGERPGPGKHHGDCMHHQTGADWELMQRVSGKHGSPLPSLPHFSLKNLAVVVLSRRGCCGWEDGSGMSHWLCKLEGQSLNPQYP